MIARMSLILDRLALIVPRLALFALALTARVGLPAVGVSSSDGVAQSHWSARSRSRESWSCVAIAVALAPVAVAEDRLVRCCSIKRSDASGRPAAVAVATPSAGAADAMASAPMTRA